MKILWPHDPFLSELSIDSLSKKIIDHYFVNDNVETIYVASPAEAELTSAYDIPEKFRFTLYPKKIITKQLKKLKLNLKVTVIKSDSLSTTKAVTELINYSQDKKIDLIMLASNSKNTLPKFIFGSFAESLIHMSTKDILIYHQKTNIKPGGPQRILYAHDYSTSGSKGLLKTIEYAKKWQCSLYVIHVYNPNSKSEETSETNLAKKLSSCEKILDNMNVDYAAFNLASEKNVDEAILSFAKNKNIDLISMNTQSSKFKTLLGGSITRKVLRTSHLPVLILKT